MFFSCNVYHLSCVSELKFKATRASIRASHIYGWVTKFCGPLTAGQWSNRGMGMRNITLSAAIFVIGLLITGCRSQRPQSGVTAGIAGDYWAKDNLDLQYLGDLLERSESVQELEAYLNEDDGINNLDLNGDGYVDYISVDEFEDRDDYERGLSLYCRYGPDVIQEVGTIVFYRDDLNHPGARVLITGDEHIYGDDFYYETNWADRTVELISFLFNPRDEYYHSPYYYLNYPSDYVVYEVVDTPVYRTRIERIYPQPVFVFTTAPTFVNSVTIDSPYRGRHIDKVYARLEKPTREQVEFIRSNPRPARIEREGRPDSRGGDKRGRPEFAPGHEPQPREVRGVEPDRGGPPKADRIERSNFENPRPGKVDRPRVEHTRPAKAENPRVERSRPVRAERPRGNPGSPARFERPQVQRQAPARFEQPRMNSSRPARAEQPRMNQSRPARVEQPKMNPSRPANPGNSGAKGGGRGKKP